MQTEQEAIPYSQDNSHRIPTSREPPGYPDRLPESITQALEMYPALSLVHLTQPKIPMQC